MKTILVAGALTILGLMPVSSRDVDFQTFAGCAARYSAEMEHAWLMSDPIADELQDRRSQFLALLEATIPADRGRDVLSYRIETKLAHASLLTLATFNSDARRAHSARIVAEHHLSTCSALLLGG